MYAFLFGVLMMTETDVIESPDKPDRLRVEYLDRPRGLGNSRPRFSWEVRDSSQGARQSAYELAVLDGDKEVWSSGKVTSNRTAQVAYSGPDLPPFGHFTWRVRTWDGKDVASPWSSAEPFSIGPLANDDWAAQWITDPTPVAPRIPAHNGFHSQLVDTPNATKWVTMDFGSNQSISTVILYPTRPHDWTKDAPGFLFPLRYTIEVSATLDFQNSKVVVDQSQADFANPGLNPVKFEFPAVNGRYVRLVVNKLAQGDPGRYGYTLAECEVFDGSRLLSKPGQVTLTASDSLDQGDWSLARLIDGDCTSHKSSGEDALPPFEATKSFKISKKVERATLYASALGAYEWNWRGAQAPKTQWLAPEWTDYFARVQFQAYDVTPHAKVGTHALDFLVGDGWYAGRIGMSQALHPDRLLRGIYGRRPELIAELHLEYADGSREVIATDNSWQVRRSASVLSSDIYDGEAQDSTAQSRPWGKPKARPVGNVPLVPQRNEAIESTKEIQPISVTTPKPATYVFDMGQNMVGTIRARFKAPRGQTVKFRFAEMLNDDGTLYITNLRGAPQIDTVIASGNGEEEFSTHFTYHGFRYVEVTGVSQPPTKEDIHGLVFHSNSPVVGEFECSDPLLNKIWQNVLWTQRANLMSSPTDCPQRDERLGWMGDILVFGQAAAYNMDMAGFYSKWLQDVRDAQATDGRFPDVAPHPFGKDNHFTGAPGWGDAGVVVPWRAYENYGDVELLRENFDACRRWVDFIHTNNPDLLWKQKRGNDYNDWLNGDTLIAEGWPRKGGEVPRDVFATMMFAMSAQITAEMATVLQHQPLAAQYGKLARQIRAKFAREFLSEDGTILGDTQAGYALALFYRIVPENMEGKVFDKMVAAVAKYGGKMSTGFHSSHALMLELSRRGRSDLAYRLAQSKEFPSWGYSVEQGATTIWERWDGFVKGRGFQDPGMNSFNHWAFGAITEWLMKVVIGIHPGGPGKDWRDYEIKPIPGGGLTHAKGSYHSLYGKVGVNWTHRDGVFQLNILVPANTRATVSLPNKVVHRVKAGSYSFDCPLPN